MSHHNLRRLIEAVETNDIVAAEKEAKTLSLVLLTDPSDARNSFVQNEGFLLTQVHWKLLVDKMNHSSTNDVNASKIRSLLASLMPTGLSKILQGNVPSSSSKNTNNNNKEVETPLVNIIRDFRQNHLSILMNNNTNNNTSSLQQLLFPQQHQLQEISNVAGKVQKWSADDYSAKYNGQTIGTSIVECCNSLADVFISAASSSVSLSSSSTENSNNYIESLKLLVFLVAGRAECSSAYIKEINAPKRRLFQAVAQFESCRGLVGVFTSAIRFAFSVWFTSLRNGVLVPKETTAKCFDILFSSSSSNKTGKTTSTTAGSRRQREEENDQQQEEEEEENSPSSLLTSFAEIMTDRVQNLPSNTENKREDADAAFSTIAQEIEFSADDDKGTNGTSSTARDVDRLIPLVRNVLFSSSFGDAKSFSRLESVLLNRSNKQAGSDEALEGRSIVPVPNNNNGGDDDFDKMMMMNNNSDDANSTNNNSTTTKPKTSLERIVMLEALKN